jgi:hypothetical protein
MGQEDGDDLGRPPQPALGELDELLTVALLRRCF